MSAPSANTASAGYPTADGKHTRLLRTYEEEVKWHDWTIKRVRVYGCYLCALAILVQILIGMIAVIIYVLYPRTNGVNVLMVDLGNITCPAGWSIDTTVGVRGKCYLFQMGKINIGIATTNCAAMNNSHLVSVKSALEQATIEALHTSKGITTCQDGYWTSGHRPVLPGTVLDEFVWYDNTDVRSLYTNWANSKPDQLNSGCLLIRVDQGLKWQDRICLGSTDPTTGAKRCYICELD